MSERCELCGVVGCRVDWHPSFVVTTSRRIAALETQLAAVTEKCDALKAENERLTAIQSRFESYAELNAEMNESWHSTTSRIRLLNTELKSVKDKLEVCERERDALKAMMQLR